MALDLSAIATRLLANLASSDYVSIKRLEGGSLNPVDGTITGGTLEQYNLVASVSNVADLTDERLQMGDKVIICDNAIKPLMSDTINFGGNDYKIVAIDGVNHAGTQQFYKVFCRG